MRSLCDLMCKILWENHDTQREIENRWRGGGIENGWRGGGGYENRWRVKDTEGTSRSYGTTLRCHLAGGIDALRSQVLEMLEMKSL